MEVFQHFDFGLVVQLVLGGVGWTIKQELSHIRESIDHVKEVVTRAQVTADKAHERIDQILVDASR